jgi:hypothetical protein
MHSEMAKGITTLENTKENARQITGKLGFKRESA